MDRFSPTAKGIPRFQRQATASGTTRQKPVTGVPNGTSIEARSGKRTFTGLNEDSDRHGVTNKRPRFMTQGFDQDQLDPRNGNALSGDVGDMMASLRDMVSLRGRLAKSLEEHADVGDLSGRPSYHTSRPVIDNFGKTPSSMKESLDKQQAEAKTAELLESIKKQLDGFRTNDSAVLIEKINRCEMDLASVRLDVNKGLAIVSQKVDLTMSGINSMKNYVIDDELLEETAEKSVAKFEEVLEDWKKEVIGLLQRKEEGLNWSQRTKELETTLAGVVEKNTVETVNGPLNQLTQSIDECRGAIDALDMMNKVHQHNYDIKDSEIEALRAEISRLVKENQPGAAAVEALRLERDKASNEAKTAATEAETLRQKLGALEEERSKWKATAMKSHSAVSTKLVETLGKMQSGLRKDFQDGKALMKAAKQFDTDATTRVETTIKALMEKNLQAERERHEELLRAIKDNAVEQKEASRRGQRSYSAGMSDREVFDEILKSPWAGPTTRTIRNLAKFDVAHNNGSRESLSHSVVYHNIVPYMSSRGCTQAFEAFLEYSQPGNEYCLFAVLEKKNGEAAGAIRSGSRHCSDHKDREDCLVARCQAAADGQGKTYIVLNPETS